MTNINDIADLISSFENENKELVLKHNYSEWNTWSIIRKPIYFKLKNELLTPTHNNNNKSSNKLSSHLIGIPKFFYHLCKIYLYHKNKNLFISQAKYITKINSHDSINLLFDEFYINNVNESIFANIGGINSKPTNINNIPFININLILRFYKKLTSKKCNYNDTKIITESLNTFFIKNKLNFTIEESYINEVLLNFKKEYKYYKFIFSIIKPKNIFTIDMVGNPIMATARSLQINIYELQHGFFSKTKPDYYFPKFFKKIKHIIPLPNKILTFNEFFKKEITYSTFWDNHEVIALGTKEISETYKIESSKRNVLLVLQPSCSKQWKKIITELTILNNRDYNFIIKPHPNDNPVMLEWYKNITADFPELFIYVKKNISIKTIINSSVAVVGFHSTSLFEALTLKKPVLSFNLSENTQLNDLVNQDITKFITPINTTKDLIRELNNIEKKQIDLLLNNPFVNNEYKMNVKKFLNEIS